MNTQTKRSPGRPAKVNEAAPSAVAVPPVKEKKAFKRNLPEEDKLPSIYEVMNGKGGIFLKIRNRNLTVFDEERGERRQIRYCPGEASVFVDEQSESALVEQVVFENKVLIVPYDKPALRRFLDLHPDNNENGGSVFRKTNKEGDIQRSLDEEFLVNDAISLIKSRPIEELLPVAMAMNINTNQNDLSVKRALVMQAKRNPSRFMSLVDSPMVMARSTVMQAFDFQIIEERNGGVVWYDTGKLIISVPVGQDKNDVMTRFVMTDKGSSVLAELERQLGDI